MKLKNSVIGVDLGGTNMRAGLIENNSIVKTAANRVPKTDNWEVVMEALYKTIESVWTNEIAGIGIGVPGIVDPENGVVFDIQNIPSWKEVSVGPLLQKRFQVPVYVNNDANCYAVGERFFGDGRRFNDFVGLITGTGLGAGIIKWGKLLPDQNCGAGEFGMIPYLDQNYEYYCSGQFFNNMAGLDGLIVAREATKGKKEALDLMQQYGRHLANAIKTIIFAVDPAAIIIGGSVSQSFSLYKSSMMAELSTFPYSRTIERIEVLPSNMPEVAILGAAALVYNFDADNS